VNNKKTILHIIQNFGRGGAETAVVGVLKNLNEYNNIVVAMNSFNQFGNELKYDKYYSLDLKSYYLFPLAIKKLRKIIIDNKVDLVHSQLYWSTVLARFACPANVPLVTTIQASLSNSFEYKKKWICWLDKFSYNHRDSTILGVSKDTLEDYFNFLKLKRHPNYVLYNFVDVTAFAKLPSIQSGNNESFKLITVGSLKLQKNQQFLLEAFTKLKDQNVSLDIYGEGLLREGLAKYITDHNLPVRLMGHIGNLNEVLGQYDLFVMSSLYEGFSLAVLEGMLMEKPMLLSNISTFTEQCDDTAVYFSLEDVNDLANKIKALRNDPARLKQIATAGKERVLQNFTLDHHMATLRKIYKEILGD
jgi:glycosyltransferase involved in cell wall biosynthesis